MAEQVPKTVYPKMNRNASPASVLDDIVAARRATLDSLRRRRSALEESAAGAPAVRPLAPALRRAGEVALIAEFKRHSPSARWIDREARPAELAAEYAAAGASAMSVLTEEPSFAGSLDDLRLARASVGLPVLRKDFILDPVQVLEARVAGADAVLLIMRILDDDVLRELLASVRELGMAALVETHGRGELERAVEAGARIIGINNRDLATFRTTLDPALELAPLVPADRIVVAESGIRGAEDVDRLGEVGVDAVLVGETLMRAVDRRATAAGLTGRRRRDRPG